MTFPQLRPLRGVLQRGFTLIELLVAIAVLSLLAVMSWRALDGMTSAQARLRERADAVLTLQASLAQWNADLDAMADLANTRALAWNGRTLRITRRSSDVESSEIFVAAWTSNGSHWRRWQSPVLRTQGEWQEAWNAAAAWGGEEVADSAGTIEVTLLPLQNWQLLYFVNDRWLPAPVSSGVSGVAADNAVPDGVRLVLELPPGPGVQGVLTRDWVRPTVTVPKT